jgi:methyl-accepting chemotaxis protein PixJ
MAMNKKLQNPTQLFRSGQSLNQQIFWVILPWVMAPIVMLGIAIISEFSNSDRPAPVSSSQPVKIDHSGQNMLFTIIFLAVGTASCGLALLMVRRLSEDLYRLNRHVSQAVDGNFTRTKLKTGMTLPSAHAQEVESLKRSSDKLISNFQKALLQQQAATAQTALFSDLLTLSQRNNQAKPIYTKAVQSLKKILNADRVFVYHFAPNWSGTLEVQAISPHGYHLSSQQVADAFFTKSMVEIDRYREGKVLVVHDVESSGFQPERLTAYQQAHTKSNIAAPIMIRQQLVGLLCVQQCAEPRQWRKWEVNICTNIANFLGIILNQTDTTAEIALTEQQTAHHLQILSRISTQLPQSKQPQDFLVTLVDDLRLALSLDRAIFLQLDPDFVGKIIAESVDPTVKAIHGEEIVDTCLQTNRGCGYETGRISAINDIYTTDLTECHLKMMEQLEIRANIVAPVIIENRLHGLLIGHMSRIARDWQQFEIDLLTQVARQMGLALTQSSLVQQLQWQKEIQVARDEQHRAAKEKLQRQLLELIDKTEL